MFMWKVKMTHMSDFGSPAHPLAPEKQSEQNVCESSKTWQQVGQHQIKVSQLGGGVAQSARRSQSCS
jgi:hypothetical protein